MTFDDYKKITIEEYLLLREVCFTGDLKRSNENSKVIDSLFTKDLINYSTVNAEKVFATWQGREAVTQVRCLLGLNRI